MSEPRRVAQKSAPERQKLGTSFKVKTGVAVGVASAAILVAGLMSRCPAKKPETKKKPVAEKCVQKECPPVPSAPDNKDKKCEADKGENNPYSPLYDPSCGYCGDDVVQDWETKDNCAYDLRCEDGKAVVRKRFGVFEPMEDGKLELTTKYVRYDKCGTKPKRQSTSKRRPVKVTRPPMTMEPKRPVVKSGGRCPVQPSGELTAIRRSIRRNIATSKTHFWSNGVDKAKRASAIATLRVSASGTITGVSLRVGGKGFSAGSASLGGLKGKSIGYPTGSSCVIYVGTSIPAGTR